MPGCRAPNAELHAQAKLSDSLAGTYYAQTRSATLLLLDSGGLRERLPIDDDLPYLAKGEQSTRGRVIR